MFSGVPNLRYALGYTNASWTLKVDLVCEYVCRLLNHMDEHGYAQCTPREPDLAARREPLIDFMSGYVLRSIDKFPKQGASAVAAAPELRARHRSRCATARSTTRRWSFTPADAGVRSRGPAGRRRTFPRASALVGREHT